MEGHSLASVTCEQVSLSLLVLTGPGYMVLLLLLLLCEQIDVRLCSTQGWVPLLALEIKEWTLMLVPSSIHFLHDSPIQTFASVCSTY